MGLINRLETQHYLKRFTSMTAEEKQTYLERVRQWRGGDRSLLRPRMDDDASAYQNVIAAATAWSDAEVKAWNEGAVLVTALVGIAEGGWLPDNIYVKSAKRAIRFITKALDDINAQYASVKFPRGGEKEPRIAYFGKNAADTSKVTGVAKDVKGQQADAFIAAMEQGKAGELETRRLWQSRPKHVDQYIHLLPEETQKKAAGVKGLFLQLEAARENGNRLMEDPHAKAATIAHWAKIATTTDEKIRAIFKEVDAEWKKVAESGRVVVDDLGNARVVESADGAVKGAEGAGDEKGESPAGGEGTMESADGAVKGAEGAGDEKGESEVVAKETKKRGRPKKGEEAERMKALAENAPEHLTDKQKAKLKSLRTWLRDTRYGNGDSRAEYQKKWIAKYKELLKIGGEEAVTDAVREAAKHYGIVI